MTRFSRRDLFAALAVTPAARLRGTPTPAPTGPVPSRIVLTYAGDPARTQAVTWRSEPPVPAPQAEIAKFSPDPDFAAASKTVPAAKVVVPTVDGRACHYAAHFEGLEPNTKYCYRVGDGESWSGWSVFRTAGAALESFRFLYVGDAQNKIRSLWSRSIRAAYAAAPDARFIVHAGDLVNDGYDDRLWGEWCDAMGLISAEIPSLPVPGNHDLHRAPGAADSGTVLAAPSTWRCHFAMPANGPDLPGMPSQSYFLDYQGTRFVALDVNAFANESFDEGARRRVQEAELAWLIRVLRDNRNLWTIVFQHQPLYAIAKDRDYGEMRAVLAPLYEKYHVDLVLQGHDHSYARTHKVARGKVADPAARGVVYAISVSGPKMYKTHSLNRELMAKIIEHKQFYQTISVSPRRIRYNAYSIEGVLVDSFELRKTAAGSVYTTSSATAGAHRV